MANFKILATDGEARAGLLQTAHGLVETPVFMPVGTQGTVKALDREDLKNLGGQIILGNTYHLYLRPGHKLIKKLGGLHKFMNWNQPILTDSGGFQAFSLGAMIEHGVRKMGNGGKGEGGRGKKPEETEQRIPVGKITEEGIFFTSHLDGSKHLLTPELSMEIQLDLGSDIVLVLDELLSPLHKKEYVESSLQRTHRWEGRSQKYFQKQLKKSTNPKAQLFGILQGVYDQKIRKKEAQWIGSQGFDGISIGGSFGTSQIWGNGETDWAARVAINKTLDWVMPILPQSLPKHGLGIGEVVNLFDCIERGVDMFDCVAPTRRARNGSLYISSQNGGNIKNKFTLNITNTKFKDDSKPIDPGCLCYTCQNFSKAYLRHLYLSSEILYHRLATIHNVYFMVNLVKKIRENILNRSFKKLKKEWLKE